MAQVVVATDLQTAQHQFQQHEARERSNMPQYTDEVYLTPSSASQDKAFTVAATFCYPILGIFGLHHFYLRRTYFGIVYACTMGLFGIGWIVDWFRLGRLVTRCNVDTSEARAKGHWIHSKKYPGYLSEKTFTDAFLLWLPPFGLFGLYHFYLGRSRYGRYQACTLGFCGLGWIFDIFRLSYMVEKANTDVKLMKKGVRVGEDPYTTSDAYLLAIPLGLFGLHHFYMHNKSRAILFLCTFGVLGIGWITDLVQMAFIVKEANKNRELRGRLQNALNGPTELQQNSVIMLTPIAHSNAGFQGGQQSGAAAGIPTAGIVNLPEPPPPYRPDPGAGETVIMEGEQETVIASSSTGGTSSVGLGGPMNATFAEGIPPKQ